LIFDYDQPQNPPGIRRIRDYLKEIDRGLFLGTSNIELAGGYRFILYFALEETASLEGSVGVDSEMEFG